MCSYCRWNIVGPSPYHYYSGKAIRITYSECEYPALGILHALHMRYIAICGLSGSTLFFNIISQMAQFSGGGGVCY